MPDAAFFHGSLGILTWLVLALVAGRIVISWLPPGRIGGHALRDLPATAASSFLIGVVVCTAIGALPDVARVAAFTVLLLIAIVRIAAAPAAMVPRHEPPLMRESSMSRAILLTAWIAIAMAVRAFALQPENDPLAVAVFCACSVAVGLLVADAFEVARCPAWVCAVGVLMYASTFFVEPALPSSVPGLCAPSLFVAGALQAIAWFRRADRRALAMFVILVAGAWVVAPGGWVLMGAGMLWLAIGTASASRSSAAMWCAAVIAIVAALRKWGAAPNAAETELPWSPMLMNVVIILFVLIVAARWFDMRQLRARAWNPSGARPGHEDAILLRMALTVLLGAMMVRIFAPEWAACDPFRPSLMVFSALGGLALRRFAPAASTRVAA